MRSLKCGCRWDGRDLSRCARHREAGSLARDLMEGREEPREAKGLPFTSYVIIDCETPAWMFESAFHHALGATGFIVRTTVEVLLEAWDRFPAAMRRRMRDDVYLAVRQNLAGGACDVEQWERVLARDAAGDEVSSG